MDGTQLQLSARHTTQVLLALEDNDLAFRIQTELNAAGAEVVVDPSQVDGPDGPEHPLVVVIDADRLGARLPEVARAWRDRSVVPGVLAIGAPNPYAPHVPLLAATTDRDTLAAAIGAAARQRFTFDMRWTTMRAALGLDPADIDERDACYETVIAARTIGIEIPRMALRRHAYSYATPTETLEDVCETGDFDASELSTLRGIDGTRTLRSIIEHAHDGPGTARLLWMFGSFGALDFTPEVRDTRTTERRTLAELRDGLRARMATLAATTWYDVLEVTPSADVAEIESAYLSLAARFAPEVTGAWDLGDLASWVQPVWRQIEEARTVLGDEAMCRQYNAAIEGADISTVWAIGRSRVDAAASAFELGQQLLVAGDIHGAVGAFDTACRHFPGHPDYETNFAWARCRVAMAAGHEPTETARHELEGVVGLLRGRRPRPSALVALALLSTVSHDVDSARTYLQQALALDPNVPLGSKLAQRLGM